MLTKPNEVSVPVSLTHFSKNCSCFGRVTVPRVDLVHPFASYATVLLKRIKIGRIKKSRECTSQLVPSDTIDVSVEEGAHCPLYAHRRGVLMDEMTQVVREPWE